MFSVLKLVLHLFLHVFQYQETPDVAGEKRSSIKDRLGTIPPVHKLTLNKIKKTVDNNSKVGNFMYFQNGSRHLTIFGIRLKLLRSLIFLDLVGSYKETEGKSCTHSAAPRNLVLLKPF